MRGSCELFEVSLGRCWCGLGDERDFHKFKGAHDVGVFHICI
ncbi:hypothetical protein RSAG8_02220, partial [Rhizoctonia solani AG-8 WAC10335]